MLGEFLILQVEEFQSAVAHLILIPVIVVSCGKITMW